MAGYGAAGGLMVLYLTDNWFSKPVLKSVCILADCNQRLSRWLSRAVPWIGDRYQGGDE